MEEGFTSEFHSQYQRNNKQGGLKNLRCFPTCDESHMLHGFCGRSVLVRLKETDEKSDFIVVGHFKPQFSPLLFQVGQTTIEIPVLIQQTLSHRESLLHATPTSDPHVFEFNKKRKGWHYGWAANKHSCNTKHCFQAYVLFKSADGMYCCRSTLESPSFVIYCRRRRRLNENVQRQKRQKFNTYPTSDTSVCDSESFTNTEQLAIHSLMSFKTQF